MSPSRRARVIPSRPGSLAIPGPQRFAGSDRLWRALAQDVGRLLPWYWLQYHSMKLAESSVTGCVGDGSFDIYKAAADLCSRQQGNYLIHLRDLHPHRRRFHRSRSPSAGPIEHRRILSAPNYPKKIRIPSDLDRSFAVPSRHSPLLWRRLPPSLSGL